MQKKNTPKLEESLSELEGIVEKLQDRETDLDNAFKLFEKGVKLHQEINERMLSYEKKIKILASHLDNKAGNNADDKKNSAEEFIDFNE